MIRMGRSSKPEQQPAEVPQIQEPVKQPFSFNSYQSNDSTYRSLSENIPSTSRPLAETESMARDIKEGRLSGFVGSGTMLVGETSFKAMLRVDGHLTGKVHSDSGTLVVGTSGQVDANIIVSAAVINGTVNGDIVASEKIELGRTARVIGNIQTPTLRIEEGAIFEGNCMMMKQRTEAEKRKNSYDSTVNGNFTPAATQDVTEESTEYEPAEIVAAQM